MSAAATLSGPEASMAASSSRDLWTSWSTSLATGQRHHSEGHAGTTSLWGVRGKGRLVGRLAGGVPRLATEPHVAARMALLRGNLASRPSWAYLLGPVNMTRHMHVSLLLNITCTRQEGARQQQGGCMRPYSLLVLRPWCTPIALASSMLSRTFVPASSSWWGISKV